MRFLDIFLPIFLSRGSLNLRVNPDAVENVSYNESGKLLLSLLCPTSQCFLTSSHIIELI